MEKIFIDPGHGGNDPGATAYGLYEKDLTLQIAQMTRDYLLENYQDISVNLSRETDQTINLRARTDQANQWHADLYLSIHINAGGGQGFESYIFSGNFANKSRTESLRSTIHDVIMDEMDWVDRGKKEANFHVLRETKMPAVLTESGFIDHRREAQLMRNNDWLKEVAINHAKGVAQALNLTTNSQSVGSDPLYRVVAGSFSNENNARKRMATLNKAGYQAYILPVEQDDKRYYRVISGAFHQRNNADRQVSKLKKDGFESFIVQV